MALLNDLHLDIHNAIWKSELNQSDIARQMGVGRSYISQVIKRPAESFVDEKFVKIFEVLGYDVQVTYKKRENQEEMSHY